MKKFTAVVLAFALFAAACGDDDAADPAAIESCEDAADATIAMHQDVVAIIGALEPAALGALMTGTEPAEFADIETTAAAIGVKSQELGCTNINELLVERVDQLTAAEDNAIGQLIIQGVIDGDEDVLGRLFR
ncbi:MAG: hypothetical protein MUP76_03195 [Acidimicrobiia bacterium]|nr:hypothetical protein [Acidimicrobiia bacterium]